MPTPTLSDIRNLITVVQARLDADPKDREDWRVITAQLRQAASKAGRIAAHLPSQLAAQEQPAHTEARCKVCGGFYGDHGTCTTVGCPGDDGEAI